MKTKKGFTLLELLVVIAIIGILSAVGLGSYMTSRKRAADSRRRSDLKQMQNAFEQFFSVNSRYPDSDEIDALFSEGTQPTQPGSGDSYTFNPVGAAGAYTGYGVCAELDTAGDGNCDTDTADVPGDCGGDGDYFCVWSLQ